MNDLSFINIFNCKYSFYGIFTPLLNNEVEQNLSLSYTNFINNSSLLDFTMEVFGLAFYTVNGSHFYLSNIQCDCNYFFIGISTYKNSGIFKQVEIIVSNSKFKAGESDLYRYTSYLGKFYKVDQFNNQFEYDSFDLKIKNDIISNFSYIKTSFFTASDLFTIHNSLNGDELNQANSKLELIFIPILSAISVIVFIFLLCSRKSRIKKDFKLINQFILDQENNVDIENAGYLEDDFELNCINDENQLDFKQEDSNEKSKSNENPDNRQDDYDNELT